MAVMSSNEVAALSGLHIETVRRDLRTGRLPARRFGKVYVIEAVDARRYAEKVARVPGRPRGSTTKRHPSTSTPSPELSRRDK